MRLRGQEPLVSGWQLRYRLAMARFCSSCLLLCLLLAVAAHPQASKDAPAKAALPENQQEDAQPPLPPDASVPQTITVGGKTLR